MTNKTTIWALLDRDGDVLLFIHPPTSRKGFLSRTHVGFLPLNLFTEIFGDHDLDAFYEQERNEYIRTISEAVIVRRPA